MTNPIIEKQRQALLLDVLNEIATLFCEEERAINNGIYSTYRTSFRMQELRFWFRAHVRIFKNNSQSRNGLAVSI
jgi:hypothetical protein